MRGLPKVLGYQFVCAPDRVTLRVKTRGPLTNADVVSMGGTAMRVDRQFGELLQVVSVSDLERTIAGKTPMVIMDPRIDP